MEVKIRVGASVDQSLRHAFRPLVQAGIDARRQLAREFAQLPRDINAAMAGMGRAGAFRGMATEARALASEQIRSQRDAARESVRIARELERERVRAARDAIREMAREHAAFEQQRRREARDTARALARDNRELDRFSTRTSHRATRFLTPNIPIASVARRAAMGFAAGVGLDTTFTGASQRNISLEDRAVDLTKQARIAGQEVDPNAIQARARAAQKRLGVQAEGTVAALAEFQKLSGDLQLGLESFDDMAARVATANIDPQRAGSLLGNIAKSLGDGPNKRQRMFEIFDIFTGQGTKGAIEVEDMARQGAKITAPARLIEGDAGRNAVRLAAIAQISRDLGGSANAMQATTSVSSLMNTFDKGARIAAFKDAGISMRGQNNMLRDPFELIKAAIVKTGGDTEKMNSFVMDAQAKRAVRGFLSEFNRAGGGEAGAKAMDALMENYVKGGFSPEVRQKNLAAHMGKSSTQVAQLQAELDAVAMELQQELLPVLRDASPTIVKVVRAFADIAGWAAQNPFKAIVVALGASILRAGIESAIRNAIERVIMGGAGASGLPGAGGGGAGTGRRLRMLHGASDMAGAGALVALAGGAAIDQADKLANVSGSKSTLTDLVPGFRGGKFKGTDALLEDIMDVSILAPIRAFTEDGQKNWKRKFGVVGEQADAVWNMDDRMNAKARADFAAEQAKTPAAVATKETMQTFTGAAGQSIEGLKKQIVEDARAEREGAAKTAREERMVNGIEALTKTKLKVEVTNFPDDEGGDGNPSVDESQRTG